MKVLKLVLALVVAILLTACGGGGGSAGTTTGTLTKPIGVTATVADLIVSLDKVNVVNSGTATVNLTAQAVDSNRNAIALAPITVSVSDVAGGAIFTSSAKTTDANGQFAGALSTGTNKADRVVSISVTANNQFTKVVAFQIAGSALNMQVVPSVPGPGTTATLAVSLADAAGGPIPSQAVTLAGFAGVSGVSLVTNSLGKATYVFTAPAIEGAYTISAAGSGVNASLPVQVVAATSTTLPPATLPVSAASLSAVPAVVSVNTAGSTAKRAQMRALFASSNNAVVQNVRVRFDLVAPVLGAGEQISSGTSMVLSDVNGVAVADYIPGTRSSPTNGVTVRACYAASDFAVGTCPNSVTATLTVAASALSLSLGDNNLLTAGVGALTYIKQFVLLVADSAGQPISGANVTYSVDIYKYGKGLYGTPYSTDAVVGTVTTMLTPQDNNAVDSGAGFRSWCPNEDTNRNGVLDSGEDTNVNGTLDPRKADILISGVGGALTTNANGLLQIQVEYPQSVATWLAYSVKAAASVAGSEGTTVKRYVTQFIDGDQKNGSFLRAPYGSNTSCSSPN